MWCRNNVISRPENLVCCPGAIKNSMSLESFKLKIRKWNPECPCRLCKTYLKHVDSI